ncbi:MAG: sodium-dependent transporter [Halioglobus sp.]|nr:sodium-dependent transporter [Halioglobus sp.]
MAEPGTPGGWRHRTTFVLALSASAVGLGNLWRFSYLTGEYGGGAFVITYVLCLFFIAAPVMVAEVVLGRYGGPSPVAAIRRACDGSLRSRGWTLVGALACLTGVLILSFYIVVAGWGMAYAGFMQEGVFSAARAAEVGMHFEQFLAEPMQQVYWQSLFLLVTAGVVVLGVRRGLGALVWLVVPLLLAMLAFLVKYGFDYGDMAATRNFLFSTRLVDFSSQSALVALGHALFTLGVGVGTGISYGAYAPQRIPIARSIMAVAVFDTVIALLAGLAIFPIVFANNIEPNAGPGLLFISLPYAFGNLMQGELAGTVFFVLMALAVLGSAVAVMEPVVAMVMRLARFERFTAALIVGAIVWLLSLAVVSSFQSGPGVQWFGNRNLLGVLDAVTARVLLPLVALLTALLVGWRLRPEILRLELARESALFFSLWRFLLRYIAPLAIALLILAPLFT